MSLSQPFSPLQPKGNSPTAVPVTSEVAFSVDGVSYDYAGRQPALREVTLSIQKGQKVAILGANGSGKSTLLKLLDGLYFPTVGKITALGIPLTPESLADEETNFAFRRKVGLVFQDPDVQLFSPTVFDDVAFGPLQLGLDRQTVVERVEWALGFLKIEHLAQRIPYSLSGGEKKKVSLASVLVLQPEVMLMDEPTAALDPRSQRALIELILELNVQGSTLVTATHDLDTVAEIADYVFVFGEDKRLQAQGAPDEILSDFALLEANNLAHSHTHYHIPGSANGSDDEAKSAAESAAHVHPHLHHDLHRHPE